MPTAVCVRRVERQSGTLAAQSDLLCSFRLLSSQWSALSLLGLAVRRVLLVSDARYLPALSVGVIVGWRASCGERGWKHQKPLHIHSGGDRFSGPALLCPPVGGAG